MSTAVATMLDESWRAEALCLQSDLDFLFISRGSLRIQRERMHIQLAICGICTVREDCLDFALETGQELGIWGGRLPAERKAMM